MQGITESEIHLFIIWENARTNEDMIIKDIDKKFEILKVYEVHWSKNKFSENLSRFYGTQLPPNSRKEVHCGTNPFLAIVVEDKDPVYEIHTTSKGDQEVNSKLFTSKTLHREWTGGGHRVHATNTIAEADHNFTLLFGKNMQDFMKEHVNRSSKEVEIWDKDLVGAYGWDNLKQLLYVLNSTANYVVLRNFEPLPDNYYADAHGDIDLLVSNYHDARLIANSKPIFKNKHRVHNSVSINNEKVYFDFRYIGDNYYDQIWEENILKDKVLSNKGFFVPSDKDYFYSLLYHGLIHKPQIGKDYIERLSQLAANLGINLNVGSFEDGQALKILSDFLKDNSYSFTQPNDKSVYYHSDNIQKGANLGAKFTKKRKNLIRNYLKSKNFPLKHYLLKIRKIALRHLKKLLS